MYNREMVECEGHLAEVIAAELTPNPFTLKKNRSPVWGIFINLQGMAAFLGSRSLARLLKNDTAGWEDVQHSSLLWYWAERIAARMSLTDNRSGRASRCHIAGCMMHAIACDDRETATWCGDALIDSLGSNRRLTDSWTEYLYFCCVFYARYAGKTFSLPADAVMGIYSKILENWRDSEQLSCCLRDACQWHVNRSGWNSEDQSAESLEREFVLAPFMDYPAEVVAILRQRRREGIDDEIAIDHPLAQTPLMHPPMPMPHIKNELLDRVINCLSPMLPDL